MRRAVGIVAFSSPFAVLAASIVAALAGTERRPFDASGFVAAGLLVALFNVYTSIVRPWTILRRRGSLDGVPHVSGAPVIGTVLIMAGGVVGFGALGTALLGIVVLVLDTGGLPWFIVATWRDPAMWDFRR